jgi:hypothetical protein
MCRASARTKDGFDIIRDVDLALIRTSTQVFRLEERQDSADRNLNFGGTIGLCKQSGRRKTAKLGKRNFKGTFRQLRVKV